MTNRREVDKLFYSSQLFKGALWQDQSDYDWLDLGKKSPAGYKSTDIRTAFSAAV